MPRWTGLHNFFNDAETKVRKVVGIQAIAVFGQLSQSVGNIVSHYPDIIPLVVLGLLLIAVGMLAYELFKESPHAIALYILVLILSLLWFFNSTQFKERVLFFDPFFSSLVHLLFLFILSGFIFYLAPKQSRELGFLIYGLAFASPTFRETVKSLDRDFFALLFFVIALSLVMNFSFTPKTFRAILETFLLSVFTVVTIGLNVYASIILPAFIIAFPKRHRRNYVYIGLTIIGIIIFSKVFGISISTKLFDKSSFYILARFIKESLVQLVLLCYLFVTNFKIAIRMRGQVLFLLILTIAYLPLLTVHPWLFASLIVIVSTLSIRLTHKLYLVTQT